MSEFNKDWEQSKSLNNGGTVPFYRPIELTEEEKAQARRNIGVTGSPDITNLENKVDELEGDVATISASMTATTAQFSTLSANVDDALTSANAALVTVGSFSSDINNLSANGIYTSATLSAALDVLFGHTTDIASVSSKNQIQDNQISTMSGTVNDHENRLVVVEGKVGTLESCCGTVTSNIGTLSSDLNTVSSNLANTTTSATQALASAQSALNVANSVSSQYTALSGDFLQMMDDASANAASAASAVLSAKQDKLVPGINIKIVGNTIDLKNNNCSAGGNNAIAIGQSCTASGPNSLAAGFGSSAIANCSFALGNYNLASGMNSFAQGISAVAGSYAAAFGYGTSALGIYAISEGSYNLAQGAGSHAQGRSTSAIADRSHTEGISTIGSGSYSHAEGYKSVTQSNYSHAEGIYCTAAGIGSHAEGSGTKTITDCTHAEGFWNDPQLEDIMEIGNGTSDSARSNIFTVNNSAVNVFGELKVQNNTITDSIGKWMVGNSNKKSCIAFKNMKLDNSATSAVLNEYPIGDVYVYDAKSDSEYPIQGTYFSSLSGTPGVILAWQGSVGQVLKRQFSTNTVNVSAWPEDKLPRNSYTSGSPNAIGFGDFANGNNYIKYLPSGWLADLSANVTGGGSNKPYLYSVRQMFAGCSALTGDVKPWMDYVLSQSAAGEAGAAGREYYRYRMFYNCTGVTNYSTYLTDPTYSGFFA